MKKLTIAIALTFTMVLAAPIMAQDKTTPELTEVADSSATQQAGDTLPAGFTLDEVIDENDMADMQEAVKQ